MLKFLIAAAIGLFTDLAKRLPRLYCQDYVELEQDEQQQQLREGQKESLQELYSKLRKAVNQRRLGLPSTVPLLYLVAVKCRSEELVASSSLSKVCLCISLQYRIRSNKALYFVCILFVFLFLFH